MSKSASMSSGVATRYAKAIFSLAKEDKQFRGTGAKDLSSLSDALKISEDLRNLISSPVSTADLNKN